MRKIRKVDNMLSGISDHVSELYQLCISFRSDFGDDYHHLVFYPPASFYNDEHSFLFYRDCVKDRIERMIADDQDIILAASLFHVGKYNWDTGKCDLVESKYREEILIYYEGEWFNYETSEEK